MHYSLYGGHTKIWKVLQGKRNNEMDLALIKGQVQINRYGNGIISPQHALRGLVGTLVTEAVRGEEENFSTIMEKDL